MASGFFYGTLMHPKVLQRVINHDGVELEICPAILLNYTRHKVKKAEYPGMIPYERSRVLYQRDMELEERSVRGTLVKGLSESDIELLDIFEGPEYIRRRVDVHPLSPLVKLCDYPTNKEALVLSEPPALPAFSNLEPSISAETYVYNNIRRLEPDLWSFGEFVMKNARKWYEEQLPEEDVRWVEIDEI